MQSNTKLHEQYTIDSATIDESIIKKLNRPFTPQGKVISAFLMLMCLKAIWLFTTRAQQWYLLGGMMLAFLVIKEIFALVYTPCKKALTKDYKVTAIITCYNEKPESIVSILKNIMELDYPVHEILFLDDGSASSLAYDVAKSFASDYESSDTRFNIIRFEENRGKRKVLNDGLHRAKGDYVFLLDSDSIIAKSALTELLRPFEDGKTTSCVGNIGILNKKENFLTRLQSISYFGSFQLGRAAQSVTGDVSICSGAFSLHKKDAITHKQEEFVDYSLFGIHVSAGDDRTLTSYSKMYGGKTRYQSTAYCETEAPNKWKKFIAQRRRWQRSAYIGSLKSIKDTFPRHFIYQFWVFGEAYFWLIAIILFILSIMVRGLYLDKMDFIIYFIIVMYKQNIFYALCYPIRFLFAPIYFLAYGLSLITTRIYAAVTIQDDDWGTRASRRRKVHKKHRSYDILRA
ncbi:MAG: glycosyltransferase family 2 protein [Defluviitaleaceae bacterium]|nr:glycosyltransferase family 2 protein [Defluviitaleaceae bacterium]